MAFVLLVRTMDTLVRRRAEADFALCRTRGFQKDELLGRITLHKMTSFLLMMTADSCARRREKLQRYKPRNMVVRCEGVKGATAKPPCRLRRGETPATTKNIYFFEQPELIFLSNWSLA